MRDLEVEVAELRAMLRAVEWGDHGEHMGDGEGACPNCHNLQCRGHTHWCELLDLIGKDETA